MTSFERAQLEYAATTNAALRTLLEEYDKLLTRQQELIAAIDRRTQEDAELERLASLKDEGRLRGRTW